MEQILQDLKQGHIQVVSTPLPNVQPNHVLIQTTVSLLSAGTERMLLNFGKASILGKIKQQPDKVKEVLAKIKTDGVATTLSAVKHKLDEPLQLGYCNVGCVIAVGSGVSEFSIGDRVLSNGPHVEIAHVGKNLCAKIPDNVSDEEAVFGVLGSIGLQGIRLAKPSLGETFVVMGLGLVGLLTAQLLKANGCRVIGTDFSTSRCALANSLGVHAIDLSEGIDPIQAANDFSRGNGVDGVLITASTKSSDPVHQAATMCRKRGRIVLVGVTGLELSRADFYEKELSFQVSCSYGPGRYDMAYEKKGQDYPLGFVRWTEQRNMVAVLDMLSNKNLQTADLVTHRVAFDQAESAYELLQNPLALGILLTYPRKSISVPKTIQLQSSQVDFQKQKVNVACLGAGNYASRMLLPAFKAANARFHTVISSQGLSSTLVGKSHDFRYASTDIMAALENPEINTMLIATRHDLHAEQTMQALQAGKHVFVEKPLALHQKELDALKDCIGELNSKKEGAMPKLMVGFNRRFSPHVQKIMALLKTQNGPKNMIMTVNAGFIPKDHWTQDVSVGGGRLLGEACHFIDLLRYIAGAPIIDAYCSTIPAERSHMHADENCMIVLRFSDGSQGAIHYLANGHKLVSKEQLTVYVNGKVLQLDNFRKLKGFGFSGFSKMHLFRQDKGQACCAKAFVQSVENGKESPIPLDQLLEVTQVCLDLHQSILSKDAHVK